MTGPERSPGRPPAQPVHGLLTDRRQRSLRDLRVSVTDRCNLRCRYCMPREVFGADFPFVERSELLRFDEIVRVVRAGVRLGVRKVRLTGGEPLLRRELATLVRAVADVDGVDDLAMTTNGVLLADHAAELAAAGLRRVTVSLDAVDPPTFAAMADTRHPVERVLEGLAAARSAGLSPLKLNTVVRRGVNDHQLIPLAAFAREHGDELRFIEYMDVGATNGWRPDEVVPAAEIIARVTDVFPAEPDATTMPHEVARRYRYLDGAGSFGVIASVTRPFCGDCVRARLSPVGELFTCLFASSGTDLRSVLRSGGTDADLLDAIAGVWRRRDDRYSELRSRLVDRDDPVEMSYIGG